MRSRADSALSRGISDPSGARPRRIFENALSEPGYNPIVMRDYRKQGSQNRLFVLLAVSIPMAAALVAAPGQAAKPPTADNLTIRAAPSPIVYNASTIISGKLTGKVKSSTTVTLVGNEAPYTGGYNRVATTTTDGSGNYRFTGVRPLLNTRYHVSTTGPKVTSADVLVQVRIKLVLRLSDPHSPERAAGEVLRNVWGAQTRSPSPERLSGE